MYAASHSWSLTSSGASTSVADGRFATHLTFSVACQAVADTCAFGIEAAAKGSTNFQRMGSTLVSVSSGGSAHVQLAGPLHQVRPFIIAKTASTTIVTVIMEGLS